MAENEFMHFVLFKFRVTIDVSNGFTNEAVIHELVIVCDCLLCIFMAFLFFSHFIVICKLK